MRPCYYNKWSHLGSVRLPHCILPMPLQTSSICNAHFLAFWLPLRDPLPYAMAFNSSVVVGEHVHEHAAIDDEPLFNVVAVAGVTSVFPMRRVNTYHYVSAVVGVLRVLLLIII